MNATAEKPLPSEYQRVEWIANPNATEYIDTDLTPLSNETIGIDLEIEFPNSTNNKWFLGWYVNGANRCLIGKYSYQIRYEVGDFVFRQAYTSGKHRIQAFTVGNPFIVDGVNTRIGSGNNGNKLCLFGRIYSGSFRQNNCDANTKLYGIKIYLDETLERNLVPCYRIADTEVGLYDVVNNVFYTNQGSGAFSKGNDVN